MIIQIDPALDRFLSDHAVAGVPILPTVLALDLLLRAVPSSAQLRSGAVLRAVEVGAPVLVSEPRQLEVTTNRIPSSAIEADLWAGEVRSASATDVHVSALISSHEAEAADQAAPRSWTATLPVGPGLVYPPYFHGPAFQVVGGFGQHGSGFGARLAAGLTGPQWSFGEVVFRPLLLELFMQGCGLVALADSGRIMIPSRIRKVSWFPAAAPAAARSPEAGEPAAVAQFVRRPPAAGDRSGSDIFDGHVLDLDGRVLMTVEGYRTVDLGRPPDTAHAATLRQVLDTGAPPHTHTIDPDAREGASR